MSLDTRMRLAPFLLALIGCGGEGAAPAGAEQGSMPEQVTAALERSAASNGGGFVLRWESAAEHPPLNEEYSFAFRLEDSDGKPLAIGADDIVVDARMPHHGHGMNQDPTVTSGSPGNFEVRGMRLHMTGHWEVYVDVRQGPVTERAEFVLGLD